MTAKEMFEMRMDGATYQQIADACGTSRQSVHLLNEKCDNDCINHCKQWLESEVEE